MPESSECRIITDQLNCVFNSQSLLNIKIVGGRYLKQPLQRLPELTYPLSKTQFNCKGKFLYWTFKDDIVLFFTLGMTGSFGTPSKHSAIRFFFDEGHIDFIDIRRFGTFKISNGDGLNKKLSSLGWDILRDEIPKDVISITRKHNDKTVAELLMDQKVAAGIGNYIKCECCYRAKILPTRLVSSLSDDEIISMYREAKLVAEEAYKYGGATIKTFADMHGNTGKFFDKFQVYGRKTDPYTNLVKTITTKDKRTSYYVEEIQK